MSLLSERNGRIKVFAVTGIRSEYDLLYPLLKGMSEDSAFDVGVIVTGAHLTPLHGFSVKNIEADGFKIVARIDSIKLDGTRSSKIISAGKILEGLGPLLEKEKPDLLLVLGDREEPLAAALAGTYSAVPVVHVAGGDHTHPAGGEVDDAARHATTKLSHVHLTFTEKFSDRILKLGEEAWRVKTVGNPGLDRIRTEPTLSCSELSQRTGLPLDKDYLVLIHHPQGSSLETTRDEMITCFKACLETGLDIYVGAPNSDPGFKSVLEVIQDFSSQAKVHVYSNLPRTEFVNLLRHAKCLVGNSSLGILEAPYLGLPVVNVGERQRGRLSAGNVQFVDCEQTLVAAAVKKAAFDNAYREGIPSGPGLFGDGHMVEKAIQFIKQLPGKNTLLAKNITY